MSLYFNLNGMQEKKIDLHYKIYTSVAELKEEDQQLIDKAKKASLNAYAPYSQFRVGTAILLDNQEIITANNQENTSYPEGLCAERTALFYASANFPKNTIKTIAIVGNNSLKITDKPITPCGGCRQVMAEYESKQQSKIRVLMAGVEGEIIEVNGMDNLLPFRFVMD